MLFNRTKIQGNYMPLLMGFTKPSKIECEASTPKAFYDPISQIQRYAGRTVGTRSLRVSSTRIQRPGCSPTTKADPKNEIDDQKFVR